MVGALGILHTQAYTAKHIATHPATHSATRTAQNVTPMIGALGILHLQRTFTCNAHRNYTLRELRPLLHMATRAATTITCTLQHMATHTAKHTARNVHTATHGNALCNGDWTMMTRHLGYGISEGVRKKKGTVELMEEDSDNDDWTFITRHMESGNL